MTEEWCAEKLLQLQQDDLRLGTLNEIKDHLESAPPDVLKRTTNLLDLPIVFDCLNNSNKEQVEAACDVLAICMSTLSIGEATNRYSVLLERALKHPFKEVKCMVLKEIARNIKNYQCLSDLIKKTSLIISIVRCIQDEDLLVGQKACNIITTIGKTSAGIQKLVSSEVSPVLNEVMATNEIVRLRMYEVMVNISKESDEHFDILKSSGLISPILSELDSDDILFKMNVIEILSELATCKHGYNFLENNNVLERQIGIFETENSDPVTLQLCEPGLLKFFGCIASWKPMEVVSKYPKVLQHLFHNLESLNFTLLGVTYDTLAQIGISNDGKFALESLGNTFHTALRTICQNVSSAPTEIKVRALGCIENFLRVLEFNSQVTTLTRKWYNLLDDSPMPFILRYAKNPFYELRLAGFGILHAMAEQHWGQQEISGSPGLIEFLMDRNIENKKECKEAKYNICKTLSNSPVFDPHTKLRLDAFVKEGPYYVQSITEVAVEGND